jgi:hypothetical protein
MWCKDLTSPADYRRRWPDAGAQVRGSVANGTALYQERCREGAWSTRSGFAESLYLAVVRERHQGEG